MSRRNVSNESSWQRPINDESMFDRIFQMDRETNESNLKHHRDTEVSGDSESGKFSEQREQRDSINEPFENIEHDREIHAPKRIGFNDDQSWLVCDGEVPEITGINTQRTRSLLISNFAAPKSNFFLKGWVYQCNEQNLYARDYATLATAVDKCDLYLTLETVYLALQIFPGGILRVNEETQRKHLQALIENIVEKFEPKYVVILSPIVPKCFENFIGQDPEQVLEDSQKVIDIISEFCAENPVVSKSKIVHYSLNSAFSVKGTICQSLFFERGNDFKFTEFGYSMIASVISMIGKSLVPRTEDSAKGLSIGYNNQLINRNEHNQKYSGSSASRYQWGNDYRPNNDDYRKQKRTQFGGHDENNSRSNIGYRNFNYNPSKNRRKWRKGETHSDSESIYTTDRENGTLNSYDREPTNFDGYTTNTRYQNSKKYPNQSFSNVSHPRTNYFQPPRKNRYENNPYANVNVEPYNEGYKLKYRRADGAQSGFTGKFALTGHDKETLKPHKRYRLKEDNNDSFSFADSSNDDYNWKTDDDGKFD